jgi:hypothetical protein
MRSFCWSIGKKSLLRAAILFVAPFSGLIHAGEKTQCQEIRLDEPGRAFHKFIPVHSQGPLPICWSYAVSQLLDAWRFDHESPHLTRRISPIDLAMLTVFRERVGLRGAYFSTAFKAFDRYGSCDEHSYEIALRSHFELRGESLSRLELQEILYDAFQNNRGHRFARADLFPSLPYFDRFRDLAESLRAKCLRLRRTISAPVPAIHSQKRGSDQRMKEELHRALDREAPAGIGFCVAPLRDTAKESDSSGVIIHSPIGRIQNPKKTCGSHAAVVIGRRPTLKKEGCEFLVRNSWGKNCNYKDSIECEYEKGSFWISENELAGLIRSVYVIEDYF